MVALSVIMMDELSDGTAQRLLTEEDHPLQALALDRQNKPFASCPKMQTNSKTHAPGRRRVHLSLLWRAQPSRAWRRVSVFGHNAATAVRSPRSTPTTPRALSHDSPVAPCRARRRPPVGRDVPGCSGRHRDGDPVLSENANGAARSNPRGVLKTRGDQPTRHWLCDRRPRAELSFRPSVSSSWRARTPMRRRRGNS